MTTDVESRLLAEWTALPAGSGDSEGIGDAAAPDRASRRQVLVELEDVRLSFEELRQPVEDTPLGMRPATGQWTVVQLMAHLASWARRTRIELESLTSGTMPLETIHFEREGGPRAWNQREVDARAAWTTAMIFEELDREVILVADIVARLPVDQLHGVVELPRTSGEPPEPWRLSLAAVVLGSCWHSRYHLARVAPLIARERAW
jgi:hypothetical protein